MARTPSRRAVGVAVLALIGALLPAVYGLQLVLDQALGTEVWLEGPVQVRVAGQDPLLLELTLLPDPQVFAGAELQGVARLHQPIYPWEATEFTGGLWLRLEPALLAGPPGAREEGWSAAYTVGDETGAPTHPPVPCRGQVDVMEATQRQTDRLQPLATQASLSLVLNLRCTSPGPDGRWATGDDLTWLLDGDLDLRRGRRPGATTEL